MEGESFNIVLKEKYFLTADWNTNKKHEDERRKKRFEELIDEWTKHYNAVKLIEFKE